MASHRLKRLLGIGISTALLSTTAAVMAPSAMAASGGGCNYTPGGNNPVHGANACISASAYAQVRGDGYVYLSYVPSGCVYVRLYLHDYTTGQYYYFTRQDCRTYFQIPAITLGNAYDRYYTNIVVFDSNWNTLFISDTSPLEYMP
jgi:hypothetical protein